MRRRSARSTGPGSPPASPSAASPSASRGPTGRTITEAIDIPTIGIGASPACDGQILVTEDVIGLFDDFTPKFAKRFANIGPMIAEAAAEYAADVRARRFPAKEHCYGLSAKDGGKAGKKRAAG